MELFFFESKFNMPLGMVHLPLRCTIIKTSNALIMVSPIDFTSDQISKIRVLGEITDIVSPSLIHHLFLKSAKENFANATVWGPPECRKKFKNVRIDKILTEDPWPYEKEIELLKIEGVPQLQEIVFFCKPAKTIITTDLCFNLQNPKGWGAWFMLRFLGTYKKFAVSRLFSVLTKDMKKFRESVAKIFNWDFDRVVMGHGEVVENNGKRLLYDAMKKKGHVR